MSRTFNCTEEIISVSKGKEDIGKLALLANDGKFDPSVIPEIQSSIPAGVVMYFAAATPPKGWLKANGSAVSRTDYAELFALVGTTFGNGDGSTTFNLPDLRGEFIRGVDDERGVDTNRSFGSNQTDMLREHMHNLLFPTVEGVGDIAAVANQYRLAKNVAYYGMGNGGNYVSSTGGSETRPRNIALLACIKY